MANSDLLSEGQIFFSAFSRSSWSGMPSLGQKNDEAAAVVLGGDRQLLVVDGWNGTGALAFVEILNLEPQQSSECIAVAPMRQARYNHGMRLFRRRVVVSGGWNGNLRSDVLNTVFIFSSYYIPRSRKWLLDWGISRYKTQKNEQHGTALRLFFKCLNNARRNFCLASLSCRLNIFFRDSPGDRRVTCLKTCTALAASLLRRAKWLSLHGKLCFVKEIYLFRWLLKFISIELLKFWQILPLLMLTTRNPTISYSWISIGTLV